MGSGWRAADLRLRAVPRRASARRGAGAAVWGHGSPSRSPPRAADLWVPEPRGLDTAHGAFSQAAVGGRPAAEVLAPGNADRLLRALGVLQRDVHELPVEGLPDRGPDALARSAAEDAAWIGGDARPAVVRARTPL